MGSCFSAEKIPVAYNDYVKAESSYVCCGCCCERKNEPLPCYTGTFMPA